MNTSSRGLIWNNQEALTWDLDSIKWLPLGFDYTKTKENSFLDLLIPLKKNIVRDQLPQNKENPPLHFRFLEMNTRINLTKYYQN